MGSHHVVGGTQRGGEGSREPEEPGVRIRLEVRWPIGPGKAGLPPRPPAALPGAILPASCQPTPTPSSAFPPTGPAVHSAQLSEAGGRAAK